MRYTCNITATLRWLLFCKSDRLLTTSYIWISLPYTLFSLCLWYLSMAIDCWPGPWFFRPRITQSYFAILCSSIEDAWIGQTWWYSFGVSLLAECASAYIGQLNCCGKNSWWVVKLAIFWLNRKFCIKWGIWLWRCTVRNMCRCSGTIQDFPWIRTTT